MTATDLSSLARFTDAELLTTLARRRAFRRQTAEQFGRYSTQHHAACGSIYAVIVTLKDRGITAV